MFAAAVGWPLPLPLGVPAAHGAPARTTAMTIHLERNQGGQAEPVRTDHVFRAGDVIRFRLTAGESGYLYVLDQGSSGSYSVLFPAAGSAANDHVEQGKDYTVPATGDGWFAVDPPAGFDTVYFLLSPAPLANAAPGGAAAGAAVPPTAAPGTAQAPPHAAVHDPALQPRCNDAVFQARGECVDSTAGPAPLPRDAVLPPQIVLAAPHASRDIVLVPEDEGTAVAATSTLQAPVVYTFRLAHR